MIRHAAAALRRVRLTCFAALWMSSPGVALAQSTPNRECAASDAAAPQSVLLPPACGTAGFKISPQQRRTRQLAIVITGRSVYVRAIRLKYAAHTTGTGRQFDMPLHRLLLSGETTADFPTLRDGLALQSVAIDVNPAGYGGLSAVFTLMGSSDAPSQDAPSQTASAMTTGSVTQTAATPAMLDPREWVLVGSTAAHPSLTRDTVVIGRAKGRFDRLVISSRGGDTPVQSVVVTPLSGPAYAIDLRTTIAAGTLSRVIAIEPADFVRDVAISYATAAASANAVVVEVRGHYADNWLGTIGENRQINGGWVLLGTVDVIASPHRPMARDALRVPGQDGQFKRLRLVARRGAVEMAGLIVDAGSGRQQSMPINTVLVPDQEQMPIVLDTPQAIESVALSPRLHSTSRIDATVEVWAQY